MGFVSHPKKYKCLKCGRRKIQLAGCLALQLPKVRLSNAANQNELDK
ncbi:MAG: hypothetical protein SOY61_05520 [Campylobacter sp.]|nr:hypothetical protein [Campylobacter sp.]